MISSFCLVECAIAGVWGRYALCVWFPKYYEDFLGSGKNFMKMRPVVIKILGVIIPLSVGGGLHSTNDFQNVNEASLSQDRSLIKFSWSYCLVRFATAGVWRRSALYRWVQKCNSGFLGPWCISGKIFMKMWSVVIKILRELFYP